MVPVMNKNGFYDLENARRVYNITDSDCKLISQYKPEFEKHVDVFIDDFYEWMAMLPEYKEMFAKQNVVNRVKKSQTQYWIDLFCANINSEYIDKRYNLGRIHAMINLPLSVYMAAVSFSSQWWMNKISKDASFSAYKDKLTISLTKLITFDSSIVSASYTQETNDIISRQGQSLLDLSTPIIELWEDVLVLPIIGVIDSSRVQQMTEQMLEKVLINESKIVILDIQGVPTLDSSVANHIIKMTKSCKLLGAQCIISGISVPIAQTLVAIGIELEAITKATLKDAFKESLRLTEHTVSKKPV